jgi:hypothetical protein
MTSGNRRLPLIHSLILVWAVLTFGDVARALPATSENDERRASADSHVSKGGQQSDSSGAGKTAASEKFKQQKPDPPAGTPGAKGGQKPGRPAGTPGLTEGSETRASLEVAGVYNFIRQAGVNCHGGGVSITYNMTDSLGAVVDVGGCKDTGLPSGISGHSVTYLFGPRINFRSKRRLDPYAQLLVGGVHSAGTGRVSANAYAMTIGGGLDVRAGDLVSLRVAQAEYLLTRFGGAQQNNFRFATGIVLRFGSK